MYEMNIEIYMRNLRCTREEAELFHLEMSKNKKMQIEIDKETNHEAVSVIEEYVTEECSPAIPIELYVQPESDVVITIQPECVLYTAHVEYVPEHHDVEQITQPLMQPSQSCTVAVIPNIVLPKASLNTKILQPVMSIIITTLYLLSLHRTGAHIFNAQLSNSVSLGRSAPCAIAIS